MHPFHVKLFFLNGDCGMDAAVGRVICIANQKGGVGKTTTAINLAASLSLAGSTTLLVDLDPQGNATSGLGGRVEGSNVTLYRLLLEEGSFNLATQPTVVNLLYLLPSHSDLIGAEIELIGLFHREHRLGRVLHGVREQYRFCLIDCPPSLGLLTINALAAADSVLVPLQCEYYALEGLRSLLETIRLVRARLNPALQLEGLLLTMFDSRNSLCHQVANDIRKHFPNEVFHTTIPRNVRLSESPSHGIPAVLYDPLCRGAQSYEQLAQEILANGLEKS